MSTPGAKTQTFTPLYK